MQELAIGWVDATMLVVVAASALIGTVRGLTFELLSLAGWFAAWFAGLALGPWLAPYLPVGGAGSALNSVVAFACAFFVVLVVWAIAARAVAALVRRTPLRPVDRLLGALFGLARGVLVLLAVTLLVGHTPLARHADWRASQGAVWLNALLRELLPMVSPRQIEAPAAQRV